jgi:hypothetical protein
MISLLGIKHVHYTGPFYYFTACFIPELWRQIIYYKIFTIKYLLTIIYFSDGIMERTSDGFTISPIQTVMIHWVLLGKILYHLIDLYKRPWWSKQKN